MSFFLAEFQTVDCDINSYCLALSSQDIEFNFISIIAVLKIIQFFLYERGFPVLFCMDNDYNSV